ncbi:hypothetical protein FI667_g2202, partial [Globisporangium splendens]
MVSGFRVQRSVKQLAPLMQEDVRAARLQHGLFGGGNLSELTEALGELEEIVSRIVQIYGGGDKGKRKALACVMQHLRKYEFSLDDFLLAAEEVTYLRESLSPVPSGASLTKVAYSVAMLNKLQIKMRRRSLFS